MIITATDLPGPAIVELEFRTDRRGFFARTFSAEEFAAAGLDPRVEQCNLSFNHAAGTVRGMHWQAPPHGEPKLVRCTRGAILDVIVDMREASATRLQHVAVELTAENRRALYVPAYFAHGYQTLTDDAEVVYQVGHDYKPESERGARYDDPALGLQWPLPVSSISDKDSSWPLLDGGTAGRSAR